MSRAAPASPPGAADVVLRDGSTVHVRPVRPDDEPRVLAFLQALGPRSRWLRFFSVASERFLTQAAHAHATAAPPREFGLVALAGVAPVIVAHGHYVVVDGHRAEIALAVADAWQGRGLGTLLLGQLAEVAAEQGIDVLEGTVVPDNHAMLEMLRESGFAVDVRRGPGEIQVTIRTSLTADARRRFDDRERTAAVNALAKFFAPRGVAVVGASRRPDTVGGRIFANLVAGAFSGPVYPVNAHASAVQGAPAYPTIEAIPGPVDLAVVAVPAEQVVPVAAQCARKGVAALLVISAGFAETGAAGRERQSELVRVCRAGGMRLIGPNCFGIVNTDAAVRLNATFAPAPAPPGPVGFLSQSGALGLAIIDHAIARGLGLSTFVSVGNKADISANDLLQYWEADPRTRVVLLYLESFGNPRKFARIARRVGRVKPIVAVKSGRSAAGSRAAASHTGALVAADVTVDALFRQAGVIRTDTLEQMLDVAALAAHQPIPRGRRVAIVTNAGGPAILCADACEAEGLEIASLEDRTRARLRALLPAAASVENPVDMIATATAAQYGEAVRIVGRDANVDALVVIFIPPLGTRADDVAGALADAARDLPAGTPVLSVFMAARAIPAALAAPDVDIPCYAFPEDAALALARVVRYGAWLARPVETPPRVDARRDEAAAIVATALARGGGWLEPGEVAALLACYGLPVIEQRIARDPEDAGLAASALGGAVALKAIAPGVLHKTEVGAVRLDLHGADEVRGAAADMAVALAAHGHAVGGFIVQRMAPAGVEMIVGVVHDPSFGPVIACGAGGVLVELLHDVAVRLSPLGTGDAAEMVRTLKSYPLLTGFRGAPARDVGALVDALVRVSALAEDLPEVAELDGNPLVVAEHGAVVVDARIRVEAAPVSPPLGAAA
ncbi:MAG: GNAT family N-acetyltransferase [Candidatus Rokubacteria bacterium]|nr:GNAT family N-acetyltransferase [Candidatus Rokubacteria bacterium]